MNTPTLLALLLLGAHANAQSILFSNEGSIDDDMYGENLANAGDVDGDGFNDLIIGTPELAGRRGVVEVRSGRTGELIWSWTGPSGTQVEYGFDVTGCGDLDNDGHAEVAFSAPDFSSSAGGAEVFVKNGATGQTFMAFSGSSAWRFGWSLAGGGDSDGDGFLELLVGAPGWYSPFGTHQHGRVYRVDFSTYPATTSLAIGPPSGTPSEFGYAVAWIGDVNFDGDDEFAVSMPYWSADTPSPSPEFGGIRLFDGLATPLWTTYGTTDDERYGFSLASAGDINNDGRKDVITGTPYYSSGSGRVRILRGGSGTTLISRTGVSGEFFGYSVDGLGDIDGDGFPEVLVGSPRDDGIPPLTFVSRGEVGIFSGLFLNPLGYRRGYTARAQLGWAVAGLGDVTGDGVVDFAASAPFPNDFLTDEPGTVYMYDSQQNFASCDSFGTGTPGTLGTPLLTCTNLPLLGTTIGLNLGNSSGTTQVGALFAGKIDANTSFYGGTLYVVPRFFEWIPAMPPGVTTVGLDVPQDHRFSGSRFVVQGLQVDPGAVQGVSFSKPLELYFGGE